MHALANKSTHKKIVNKLMDSNSIIGVSIRHSQFMSIYTMNSQCYLIGSGDSIVGWTATTFNKPDIGLSYVTCIDYVCKN